MNFAEADLSRAPPLYLGIPPSEAEKIRFRERPAYFLTIENFASFNRHVIEADPDRLGATIYVGGYPSLATQEALRTLAAMLPNTVPIFHWSDIDADGTWIFRTIERAVGRTLRPHLMSPEIAERSGRAPAEKIELRLCPRDSGIFLLAEYLAREDARTLEQEELDPELPVDLAPASGESWRNRGGSSTRASRLSAVRMSTMTPASPRFSIRSETTPMRPALKDPGSAQQAWPLRIGSVDRLLGAEHDHRGVRSDVRHGIGKVVGVGCGGRETLLTHALGRLVGAADYYRCMEAKPLASGESIGDSIQGRPKPVLVTFRP